MCKKFSALFSTALVAALCGTASAYTLSGTVTDTDNNAISDAKASLIAKGKSATTDNTGKFTIQDDNTSIQATRSTGSFNLSNGILNFTQGSSAPVQVKVFDLVGNQIFNQSFQGSGSVDLSSAVQAQGTYLARIKLGSAQETFRFKANGNYSGSVSMTSEHNALFKSSTEDVGDTLQITADDYATQKIYLSNLDTNVEIKLVKNTPAEETFAFGYALGNAPTPSKGCGKNSTLQQTGANSNATKFSMRSADLDRAFWLTLPSNYDNNKPYKILFAMHCMGSVAEDFTQHTADYDHPSPYYGQQNLDTESNYIFVSPESNSNSFGPWRMDDKDHTFFGDMLTLIEENYCIDTSRVFVTGFSFGAMFTNSLAWDYQDRIRAVAVYATAAYNIYLPQGENQKKLPIAWMAVHGKNDGTCPYDNTKNPPYPGARDSALVHILRLNSAEGMDAVNEKETSLQEIADNTAGHVCYDFNNVDPRFPVKWCSWNGPHRWAAHDEADFNNYNSNNWSKSWVPGEVHKFFEQF